MKISTKGRYALRLMLDLASSLETPPSPCGTWPSGRRSPINIWNRSSPSWPGAAWSAASGRGGRLSADPGA